MTIDSIWLIEFFIIWALATEIFIILKSRSMTKCITIGFGKTLVKSMCYATVVAIVVKVFLTLIK